MKGLFTVFKFELMGFLKKKSFIVSTVLICLIIAIGLSIPTIQDTFFSASKKENTQDLENSKLMYGYVNQGIINMEDIKKYFSRGELIEVNSMDELEEKVNSGEFETGFIIEEPTQYAYVVKNNEMIDNSQYAFEEALTEVYRINELEKRGIDYGQIVDVMEPTIESKTIVLGKDSARNYIYTYILVFGLYFMIILYGQLIATSVASEKNNRTMEVLITSTKSSNLIFGKILGGALAGAIQFGLIIVTAMLVYNFNAAAWNHQLDFVFRIPVEVLLKFSAFGILGYLFYSFIYGALGALVSRTEDVSSSATPVTLIFMAVFFVSITGMRMPDSILLKIASFLPVSSFMAMFVRISMGSVSNIEVVISLIILLVSTILVGILGAMIYRMGSLMYGNPIKIKEAIKLLLHDKA